MRNRKTVRLIIKIEKRLLKAEAKTIIECLREGRALGSLKFNRVEHLTAREEEKITRVYNSVFGRNN